MDQLGTGSRDQCHIALLNTAPLPVEEPNRIEEQVIIKPPSMDVPEKEVCH